MVTIEHNGINISIRKKGTGEPVIFLHSSANSNKQWNSAFDYWDTQYLLLAPDLYSSGCTGDWPGIGNPTLADEVALVNAVISNLDRPVHLVGHSYGGAVALRLALLNPELVQSLCMIEPVVFNILRKGTADERELFAEITDVAQYITQAVAEGYPFVAARRFINYWNGAGTWQKLNSDQQLRLSHQAHKLPKNFSTIMNETIPLSLYGCIDVQTLILCGTKSPNPTRQISRMLAEIIPDARHRTIPYAGHMLPITHPTQVNAAIEDHLMRALPPSLRQAA